MTVNENSGFTSQELQILKRLVKANETALSGKQDKLTAGANITIADNVISASSGSSYRLIRQFELSEPTNHISIAVDQQDHTFELDKIIIAIEVPASGAETNNNGYVNIAVTGITGYPVSFGPFVLVNKDYSSYILVNVFDNTPIPAIAYISINTSQNLLAGSNMQSYVDKNTTGASGFTGIKFDLNSGNFPSGTTFHIIGIDKT